MSKFYINSIVGRTITYFHPHYGAVAMHIDDPPPASDTDFQKKVDKTTNLQQNINMKHILFVTAVALAVDALRELGKFSIHDVTVFLREKVSIGEYKFSDRVLEDVPGVGVTFKVDHQEVKKVFLELVEQNVIKDLSSTFNGTFREYQDAVAAHLDIVGGHCCTKANDLALGRQPSLGPMASANTNTQYDGPLPPKPHSEAKLLDAIRDYLLRCRGNRVTLKRLQSRFKGVRKTCKEYATLITQIGIVVDTQGTPSQWTVAM